jgi:hypothetical protein
MKIVVKKIENVEYEYLVYLKTDDDVNVHAEFANKDTYEYVINELTEGDNSIPVFMNIGKEMETTKNNLPLVLVFYLNRELMSNAHIIKPFADAVNDSIADREANAMAFFLPTDGLERIECINPLIATKKEKSRISKMIDEIEKNFDIGQGAEGEDYDDINIINTSDDED